MLSPIEFLTDLFNPQLQFLARALLVAMLSSVLCGVVGTHVVLRGMAFIGDAIAHAVFPGLAIAFVLGGSLLLGGILGGVTIAIIIALFAAKKHLPEDSTIGIFFAFAFAIGLIVLSRAQGYAGSLSSFLSGSITGVSTTDLLITFAMTILALAIVKIFHQPLITVGLDRESAKAAGIPTLIVDLILYITVALTIVTAVRTVGNILVIALLITPAATARLLTRRMLPMMILSAAIGATSSLIGVYLAWSTNIPVGAAIVVTVTVIFLFSLARALPRKILAAATAVLLIFGISPAAAKATENPCAGRTMLHRMHVDAVYVTRDGGELTIKTIGDTTTYDADQVCMQVAPDTYNGRDVSHMTVPDDPALGFLGTPGTQLWHAPFENYGFSWRPIWAGMGAFDPAHETQAPQAAAGLDAARTVTLELASFDGPGHMEIFNYIEGWGRAHRFISSRDIHRTTLPIGGHSHMNWTFTQPGYYILGWRAHLLHLDGTTESTPIIPQIWKIGDGSTPTTDPDPQPSLSTTAHTLVQDRSFSQQLSRISRYSTTESLTTSVNADLETESNADVVEIPDTHATCIDTTDPVLGQYATASGSPIMWRTSTTVTIPDHGHHLFWDSSLNGPAGFVSAVGISHEDKFMPVRTIRMPETRELRLTSAGTHTIDYLFSHPGIYRENGTLSLDDGSENYNFLSGYFLVGNEAINKYREAKGLEALPTTSLDCATLPSLQGLDPHYHPFLPPEPAAPTESNDPAQPEDENQPQPDPQPEVTNPITIRRGHVDMSFVPGQSGFHDTSGSEARWVNSGDLSLTVNGALAEDQLPGTEDTVYVLPQTQNSELPWLGLSTEKADFDKLHPEYQYADLTLTKVDGPADSRVWVTIAEGATQKTLLDSNDPSLSLRLIPRLHQHPNFIFTKTGNYTLHFAYTWTDTEGTAHTDPLILKVKISGAAAKPQTPPSAAAEESPPSVQPSAVAKPKPEMSKITAATKPSTEGPQGPGADREVLGAVLAGAAAIGIANHLREPASPTTKAESSPAQSNRAQATTTAATTPLAQNPTVPTPAPRTLAALPAQSTPRARAPLAQPAPSSTRQPTAERTIAANPQSEAKTESLYSTPGFWNGLLAGAGIMSLFVAVFFAGMTVAKKNMRN
ncbi:MAG: anchored repeat-type ABC transporter permease subunit [Corynebacterium sp.]|nr:anchored repeat-type ABC transporter permease subunit [Corynebacterium sp.]